MNISILLISILNSIQSSSSEHIAIHTLIYPITPLLQVFCKFSILTISYPSIVFNSYSMTLLVPIYDSFRPASRPTVLCRLHSFPFITKCNILEMWLVSLVCLPFLYMHTAYLISNIIRCACYGTTYVSLFIKSLLGILKCDISIPTVYATL